MNAAHEPSMDDILKSIRRIIRSDQDETDQQREPAQALSRQQTVSRPSIALNQQSEVVRSEMPKRQKTASQPAVEQRSREVVQEEAKGEDGNLIQMEIHDQKRLRILEKKLQKVELEYEQKLQLHRQKMSEYRRRNQELTAAMGAYETKIEMMSDSLKTAYDCLEKLQVKNKELKEKVLQMARFEQGTAILKTIQREFSNLYHPDQTKGDRFSRAVRHEVYNEFSQILQGVQSRFVSRRA